MLKLYSHPFSTFGRRVTMALLEKGIEYEPITVDMAKREHRGEAYRKLNPYGRVPTLVDGDFVLYESSAILNYLEAIHPEPALLPESVQERARVDMHMKLCDLELGAPSYEIVFAKRFLPKEKWNEASMAKQREKINRHLAILGAELEGKEYLVGERFTLADLCYAPLAEFFGLMEVDLPPSVAAWAERLLARPSAVQTKPAM